MVIGGDPGPGDERSTSRFSGGNKTAGILLVIIVGVIVAVVVVMNVSGQSSGITNLAMEIENGIVSPGQVPLSELDSPKEVLPGLELRVVSMEWASRIDTGFRVIPHPELRFLLVDYSFSNSTDQGYSVDGFVELISLANLNPGSGPSPLSGRGTELFDLALEFGYPRPLSELVVAPGATHSSSWLFEIESQEDLRLVSDAIGMDLRVPPDPAFGIFPPPEHTAERF